MKTIEKIFTFVIGVPLCLVIFLAICLFATLLWPIYLIFGTMDCLIKLCTKQEKSVISDFMNDFLEFIFTVYGFGAMFVILPFSVISGASDEM